MINPSRLRQTVPILLQVQYSQLSAEDEKWHLVAFLSKSLSETERNYEIHDKEMLAIIRALEEWRHFLEGASHKFEIWMDHKNLEYFMSAKSSTTGKHVGPSP